MVSVAARQIVRFNGVVPEIHEPEFAHAVTRVEFALDLAIKCEPAVQVGTLKMLFATKAGNLKRLLARYG